MSTVRQSVHSARFPKKLAFLAKICHFLTSFYINVYHLSGGDIADKLNYQGHS